MKFCHFWPPANIFLPTPGHNCRSRQIFGHAKDFCPKSPKLAEVCQGFCSHFNKSKHLGCAFPPAPPPTTPLPLENPLLALVWKKSFRHPCLRVHAHLPKCWRGTWPEEVWEPLVAHIRTSMWNQYNKSRYLRRSCTKYDDWPQKKQRQDCT